MADSYLPWLTAAMDSTTWVMFGLIAVLTIAVVTIDRDRQRWRGKAQHWFDAFNAQELEAMESRALVRELKSRLAWLEEREAVEAHERETLQWRESIESFEYREPDLDLTPEKVRRAMLEIFPDSPRWNPTLPKKPTEVA